jgi:hypothetical protein
MIGAWIPRRESKNKMKKTYRITQKKMVQTYWKTAKEKAELARTEEGRLCEESRYWKLK